MKSQHFEAQPSMAVFRRWSGAEPVTLGQIERNDGCALRFGCFGNPNAPYAAVLVHGRTEFLEMYAEVIGELCARGFSVWALELRGHGLSSRPLSEPHKCHIDDFALYLDDLVYFITEIVGATPNARSVDKPLMFVGHSLGGHLGFRFLCEHPGVFDAAVLSAPMLGIQPPAPLSLVRLVARAAVQLGFSETYAEAGNYDASRHVFAGNVLTRDMIRFYQEVELLRHNPALALGGLTFGWLHAALCSLQTLETPGYVENLQTPTLVVCAGQDRRVNNLDAAKLAARNAQVQTVSLERALHAILMEKTAIRDRFWDLFGTWVSQYLEPMHKEVRHGVVTAS